MTDSTRRTDIDWLRIAATYLLFVFHVGKVFDPAPFFHIRSQELSMGFTVLCGFISLWHMPLFFMLAGWSAAASLSARGGGAFLRERGRRLALPLLAGCVLFGPIMKYAELSSGLDLNHRTLRMSAEHQNAIAPLLSEPLEIAPDFEESFLEFLPSFFTDLDRFTWGHLWFVAYLLALTVALMPLMLAMLRWKGRLAQPRPWMLYAPMALLVVVQLTMRERWPGIYNLYDDWANVAYYAIFVASGFALATQPQVEELVASRWKVSLGIAVATSLALLTGLLGLVQSKTLMLVGPAVAGWCYVLALLGIGRRMLIASGPAHAYLSESTFPVYILHQVAIIVVGYWLIRLTLPLPLEFVLLVAASLTATMGIYHYLVRPFALPRLLLGMKPPARRCAVSFPELPKPSPSALRG
ncbi:MAG TPA: acyltransferase [Candidatus Limnocylindrales bacterium]|nr:acyltransferase [Candidatus Limnocylindrales bacterium]